MVNEDRAKDRASADKANKEEARAMLSKAVNKLNALHQLFAL